MLNSFGGLIADSRGQVETLTTLANTQDAEENTPSNNNQWKNELNGFISSYLAAGEEFVFSPDYAIEREELMTDYMNSLAEGEEMAMSIFDEVAEEYAADNKNMTVPSQVPSNLSSKIPKTLPNSIAGVNSTISSLSSTSMNAS